MPIFVYYKQTLFYRLSLQLVESGMFRYIINKYTSNAEKCRATLQQSDQGSVKPIKLVDLASAFLILAIGIPLSILAFVLELIPIMNIIDKLGSINRGD